MAANKHKEILFVFHDQKQSKRSQELQDAKRRAHAARQSARKNREVIVNVPSNLLPSADQQVVAYELPARPADRGPVRRYPTLPPIDAILDEEQSPGLLRSPRVSPMSVLSQDLADPFRTTIVGQLPTILQKGLHDAQTSIWPTLVPLVPREQATFFYRRSAIDTPEQISHQIDAAAAITVQYVKMKDRESANEIIAIGKAHRLRSITWVNNQIVNANGPPDSAVIAALMSLVSHSGLQRPDVRRRYRVEPELMAEFASLFSSIRILSDDIEFLHAVVEMKGGDAWIGSETIDRDLPLRLMLNQ
jgi:hypothetical protein